jgi:hypothetical protein
LQEGVPAFERAVLFQTGPQVGISRQPQARHELTGTNLADGRQRSDGLRAPRGPWERHDEPGRSVYGSTGGDGFAHVPLDALRASDIDNHFLAGRVIGSNSEAYASVRMMGTAFATCEAAGVAAASRRMSAGSDHCLPDIGRRSPQDRSTSFCVNARMPRQEYLFR